MRDLGTSKFSIANDRLGYYRFVRRGRILFGTNGGGSTISTVKRRHGLARCRYRGVDGMRRWIGRGVIADNLINIGTLTVPLAVLATARQDLTTNREASFSPTVGQKTEVADANEALRQDV